MTDVDGADAAGSVEGAAGGADDRPGAVTLGATVAVGVVAPGVAAALLYDAGAEAVGTAVWATGYATMVLVVWYVWVRPMEFVGPD